MIAYCQTCGKSFRYIENPGSGEERKRKKEALKRKREHERYCEVPSWRREGGSEPTPLTWWQAKRRVFMRDSTKEGDNPWNWHPSCQVCGRQSLRTVDDLLSSLSPGNIDSFEVHHIIPRVRGGTEDPGNLITLCGRCHKKTLSRGKERGGVPESPPGRQQKLV